MLRMSDSELIEVLPQFLGISIALGILSVTTGNVMLLYGTLGILVALLLRIKALLHLGRIITDSIKLIGILLVNFVLGIIYFTFVTIYAYIYRLLNKETVEKFTIGNTPTSSYIPNKTIYDKKYFERLW